MKSRTTWFFVGDGARARIFSSQGPGSTLRLVEERHDDEARQRSHEIGRDRPPRGRKSGSDSRFALDAPSPHDQAEEAFVRACAARLDEAAAAGAFDQLVLIAPPAALGRLRRDLSPGASKLVVASLDKDLVKTPQHDLPAYFEKHLERW